MKRLVCFSLILAMFFLVFCSCEVVEVSQQIQNGEERFAEIYIQQKDPYARIYVDEKTKVQYFRVADAGITPLLDENGNVLLYEGELE